MPGTFEKNNIATNNVTSADLSDTFVLVCIFPCVQEAAMGKKNRAFNWKQRSKLGQSSGSIQVCPIEVQSFSSALTWWMRQGLGLHVLLYVDAPSAWQMAAGLVTTRKSKQPEPAVVHSQTPHSSSSHIIHLLHPMMELYKERTIKTLTVGWRTHGFSQISCSGLSHCVSPGPENTTQFTRQLPLIHFKTWGEWHEPLHHAYYVCRTPHQWDIMCCHGKMTFFSFLVLTLLPSVSSPLLTRSVPWVPFFPSLFPPPSRSASLPCFLLYTSFFSMFAPPL